MQNNKIQKGCFGVCGVCVPKRVLCTERECVFR